MVELSKGSLHICKSLSILSRILKKIGITIVVRTAYMRTEAFISKGFASQMIVAIKLLCVHAYELSEVWSFKFWGITIVVRTAYMRTEAFISKGFARAK